MKPTAVSLAVILLAAGMPLTGSYCITNDNTEAVAAGDTPSVKVLLKKDSVAPAAQPVYTEVNIPKKARVELVHTNIKTIVCKGVDDYGDVIPPPIDEEDSSSIKEEEDKAFIVCALESEAEYPGGTKAWLGFLNKNLRFLSDSGGNEITGTVKVQFVIDEEGNVTDVKAVSGSEPLSTEAVRVIKKSNKWIPARRLSNGRCVRSYKIQPVIFKAT